MSEKAGEPSARGGRSRLLWLVAGLFCVAVGGVGVVVPGLPTTVFFIGAAACFARSSARMERWVLGLPGIGRAVEDYRRGLGMPRAAKISALVSIALFSGLALVLLEHVAARAAVAAAAVAGIVFVWRVPAR